MNCATTLVPEFSMQDSRVHPDSTRHAVAIARGDGIGPEIMDAVLEILDAAGARIEPVFVEVGEKVYRQGITSGIAPQAWAAMRQCRVLLKGPITTPQGGGYKSLNVTLRKTLGLYANVRPCVALHPFVPTRHPQMDVVVVRENEEDLYAGIEHRQTEDVYQCLKLISRTGCERIVRYAFEFARTNQRRKVTCFTKDNIMKMTDGLFHKVFERIAAEYPEIAHEHMIVDIGAARLATRPEQFDVIVMPNLYGDILSDVAAELTGSVGLAGSANIGNQGALFEAIHGSAPDIAGQDKANPSGLLQAAVLMLHYIGQPQTAERIHNAWLRAIEDGVCTWDIAREKWRAVGTREFARQVIARLDKTALMLDCQTVRLPTAGSLARWSSAERRETAQVKCLVGVDVFLDQRGGDPDALAAALQRVTPKGLSLSMITNRGVKVWPDGLPETLCVDHWRCRFQPVDSHPIGRDAILALLTGISAAGFDFIKTENLYTFDGQPGYSLGQGQ